MKKPTPVKLPDDLKESMHAAAKQDYEENLSAAIRAACRFWLENRNRQTPAPRVQEEPVRLPWLEKRSEKPAPTIKATGMVWKPGK